MRWSWAVLGVVVVLLGSVTFILTSQSPTTSSLQKTLLEEPGAATRPAPTSTTAPRSTPTSGADQGQAASSGSGQGIARNVPLGAFVGGGNPSGVAKFAAATGTHMTFATDYLDRSAGWSEMDSASGIKAWSSSPYRMAIGVPILPGVGTLAQGATGAYNQYFTILGENLVSDHEADAILRLGWEFNGNWYRWSVTSPSDAANFVGFWRQIVTTMRAVPGAKFKFMWNPNAPSVPGPPTFQADQAYPGDAYVDYVGTDIYDNFWGTPFTPGAAWVNQLTEQWGLNWLATFAAQHHKPIGIPEWSDEYRTDGHGLGDDPSFIDNMAYWFVAHQVAFANVFAFDTNATYRNDILDGTFPKTLAEFKVDFG